MTGIVLVTHAGIAEALCRQVEVILDHQPPLTTVSMEADADIESARLLISDAIEAACDEQGVVVLTDLPGATPHNLALEFADCDHHRLISGLSLPMLLKVITHRHQPPLELAKLAEQGGCQGIVQS